MVPLAMACGAGRAPADGTGQGQAEAACADVIRFHNHSYMGMAVQVAPMEGAALGGGERVWCDDQGGGSSPSEESIQVAELAGVSPDDVIVERGNDGAVYIADGLSPLPPEVEALSSPPGCDPADEPIELSGPWSGVLGADGDTELDLVPPYDVFMQVRRASSPRYERASLTIRVPIELGRPISHADVEAYLWKEGSISATVTCRDGAYVAMSVTPGPLE
jgi:hypothetical protein